MKPILAAATTIVAFALLAPFASAQEDSATPSEKLGLRATDPSARTDPSVVVPSERNSSGDYPTPGTPLASPKASPSATAAATKTTSRSKTKEAAKPSPSPAAATASSSSKTGEAAVRQMENRWLSALQTHDAATVQTLVADNYIGVTATGRSVTKTAMLADVRKDKNNYESANNLHMDVRMHGGDTAVVVGTTRQVGKDATGKAFTYYYRWTDTWAQQNGQWVCVASQSIQVPK